MKLLIISNMSHHLRDGEVVGWGPTAQEIDHLSGLFDEVRHVACLDPGPAPASMLPYRSERVTLVPVPPAGGTTLGRKLGIVRLIPHYLRTILRELPGADVVHVRCPANLSILACLVLALRRFPRRRWVKYAGNWKPRGPEAWSYTFQRWWLGRGLTRGKVTVNGSWAGQPPFVRSFLNPCLSDSEVEESRRLTAAKALHDPLRLLFVGRLETEKGARRVLQILALVRGQGIDATLDLVGDGPERADIERLAGDLGVAAATTFHGWVPRVNLAPLYERSHLMLLPSSSSEGWPKVVSEAMAYGVVPICSDISSIPQILARAAAGTTCAAGDVAAFAAAIRAYRDDPDRWRSESLEGSSFAEQFSYRYYLDSVRDLLELDRDSLSAAAGHLAFRGEAR